ncbi:threonine synthase [Sphingomonas sp. RB1R13]|uniref:threonine synthase n=1 Tax=Sphingomonas sp. RB1R13 TaxID=3096159 RepID=UPI002FCCB055
MRFTSTRGQSPTVSLSEAIRNGAAPDGGLYLPERQIVADPTALDPALSLPDFAARFLAPFFAGDELEPDLPAICTTAFDFPIEVKTLSDGRRVLELFHGPTGAFKDFGARFLMACLDRLGVSSKSGPARPLTVLAATSGDTGGAVGCAAEGCAAVRAVILYPKGRVSPFQEHQLTCWNAPVRAIEVDGDFDDCQRLAKAAFADPAMTKALNLTSANSISIGRLMPQMAYVAFAATRIFAETGHKPGFVIPTGNLGHGFAALYARAMGAPIGPLHLATNENRTLADWAATGLYEPRPSVATIANAMDVGAPSNFERLISLPVELREVTVELVTDDAIKARIIADQKTYLWCPHSAAAAEAYARLPQTMRDDQPWLIAATAHPYKFADVIEPLTGETIPAPRALAAILSRPSTKDSIGPSLAELEALLSIPA